MRGVILDFSIPKNEGIISGDDSKRYTFAGSEWKAGDVPIRGMRVDFAPSGTLATAVYRELTAATVASAQEQAGILNLFGLTPYYQEEFGKIHSSGETYKGKWNWPAFLFGAFWAITKGMWLSALVALVVSFFTDGIGGLVYWFIFGLRGNYIYYTLHVKKRQLIA